MKDHLFGLNDRQLEAVTTVDQHSTVLSCPGSGKTRIVESKVTHILKTNPHSFVCCTTFSKEGAGEIEKRVIASLPPDIKRIASQRNNNRLTIGTFHSICYRKLQSYFGTSPKIARPGEIAYAFSGAAYRTGIDPKSDTYSDLKDKADSIPTMSPKAKSELTEMEWDFFSAYKECLHSTGKIDFNDMLVKTVQLLENGTVPPDPYTHLVTDESQDNDYLMQSWILVHARNGTIVTTLLDDDQSMYSFRNALGVEACLTIEDQLGAYRITNATNYRSYEEILKNADKLIRHNEKRVPKDLIAHRGTGGTVKVHHIFNQYCTETLLIQLLKDNPADWFVLCRTNADIKQLAPILFAAGIPFKGPDPTSIFDQESVQVQMELLRSLANNEGPGVELSLKFLGFDSDQISAIHKTNDTQMLAGEDFTSLDIPDSIQGRMRERLIEFFLKMDNWKRAVNEKRPSRAIRQSSSYLADFEPAKFDCPPIESAAKILSKLNGTILQRLNAIKQMVDESKTKNVSTDGKVVLMTAHASKGLQRPSVLLWNCREGAFPIDYEPGQLSEDEHYEEERRVFYVAMTRAENELHMVYQSAKATKKGVTDFEPSRFLREMDYIFTTPSVLSDQTAAPKNVAFED